MQNSSADRGQYRLAAHDIADLLGIDVASIISCSKSAWCVNCACRMPVEHLKPLASPVDYDLVYGAALGRCPWCSYVCREA